GCLTCRVAHGDLAGEAGAPIGEDTILGRGGLRGNIVVADRAGGPRAGKRCAERIAQIEVELLVGFDGAVAENPDGDDRRGLTGGEREGAATVHVVSAGGGSSACCLICDRDGR